MRGVFRVGDDKVRLIFFAQRGHNLPEAFTSRAPDDIADIAQMRHIAAFKTADHRVRQTLFHRECGNDRGVGAHQRAGRIGRGALAPNGLDQRLDISAIAGVVFRIDQLEVTA